MASTRPLDQATRRESWQAPSYALNLRRLLTYKGMHPAKVVHMVQEVFSRSFCFVRYGCQRRRRRGGRRNIGKVEGALYMQAHLRCEARLAICSVQSPLLHGELHLPNFGPIQEQRDFPLYYSIQTTTVIPKQTFKIKRDLVMTRIKSIKSSYSALRYTALLWRRLNTSNFLVVTPKMYMTNQLVLCTKNKDCRVSQPKPNWIMQAHSLARSAQAADNIVQRKKGDYALPSHLSQLDSSSLPFYQLCSCLHAF